MSTITEHNSKVGRIVPNAPWPTVRLGAVAKTGSGGTPKRSSSAYYGGGIPWVKSGELGDSTVYETQETISKEGLDASSAKLFPKGTLCVALYGATVGKLGVLGIEAATNQAVCGIFLPPDIDTRFVYRFLESKRRELVEMGKGGAQSNISQEIIRNLRFPLPPLPEQRRIVAEIEKQFTRLEAGVAALRRVQANLKRYRAAVLKAACEGRLVENEGRRAKAEGRSVETGEQLLKRILIERRRNWQGRGQYKEPAAPDTADLPPLPTGWTRATVEQLSNRVQYGHTASAIKRDDGVRFLRITDIQDRRVEWDLVPSCDILPSDVDGLRLLPGDLVFARTGATVGKSFLLKAPFPESVFASYLIRISPAGAYLSRWLHAFFQSPDYWIQIRESAAGIGQPNVNGTKLQALQVPLPPLAEQERIVAEVERRLSVVEELEAVVSANLQRATRFRQSILQQAFTG